MIRGCIGERSAPSGNQISFGESMVYQHLDGSWYHKETHELAQVTTLDKLLKEFEVENDRKRQEATNEP